MNNRFMDSVVAVFIFLTFHHCYLHRRFLISMLNATLQTHHTLTQLYDTLMKLLSSESTNCASSKIPPTSCHQLTCDSLFRPELTLACNLEDRVLSELSNLVGVLRQEVSLRTYNSLVVMLVGETSGGRERYRNGGAVDGQTDRWVD